MEGPVPGRGPEHLDRFAAVGAGDDVTPILREDRADAGADLFIVVGDEHALADHVGIRSAAAQLLFRAQDRLGPRRACFDPPADLLDRADDLIETAAGPGVRESFLAQRLGPAGDLCERITELAEHIAGHLLVGREPLHHQEVQDVHGHRDVAAEDRRELPVVLVEGVGRLGFDVKDADRAIVQPQRHRQRAGRIVEALPVQRVLRGVVAEIALAGDRDVPGDAVALGLGVDDLTDAQRRDADRDHEVETVGLTIQHPHFEVIELQEIVDVLHDLLLQQLQPLGDRERRDRLRLDLHQFASGGVDGVQLVEQSPGRRDVPQDAHDGGEPVAVGRAG